MKMSEMNFTAFISPLHLKNTSSLPSSVIRIIGFIFRNAPITALVGLILPPRFRKFKSSTNANIFTRFLNCSMSATFSAAFIPAALFESILSSIMPMPPVPERESTVNSLVSG